MATAQSISRELSKGYEAMPPRIRVAARWVLDHPVDVALLSMRDQARRAGVPPATLTRLAQRMGYSGFDDLRKDFAASIRRRPESFQDRAEELIARRARQGDGALAMDILSTLAQHCRTLSEPTSIASIAAAARALSRADRVFCVGHRSSYPIVYLFHYVRALAGERSVLVDGAGGIGVDMLRGLRRSDAVFAVSVQPYTRLTLDAVRFAAGRRAGIVAVTDSAVSPLARLASEVVLVGTETSSFFHTMAPAFAVVECLAALIAARKGTEALSALSTSEDQLAAFDTYLSSNLKRRPA